MSAQGLGLGPPLVSIYKNKKKKVFMVHIKHTKGTKIVTTNESQNCTMITIFFKREKKYVIFAFFLHL